MIASCTTAERPESPPVEQASLRTLTVSADGESRAITTAAATVADVLAEAGIGIGPFDEVDPPLRTRLPADEPATITIVRVTESLEVIPESVPYGRRIVRSAEMAPGDPPRIIQTGVAGLKETSYRLVFHDGLETERYPVASTITEDPIDEILMIGVGEDESAMQISGRLAYISGGRAIILSGSTSSARQLPIEGQLDGRVFQLSSGGNYLLYTIRSDDEPKQTEFRNELWVIPVAGGGLGRPLQVENVLWAGWDPSGLDPLRIAWTTARSVSLPPGWEANNDLWLMEVAPDGDQPAPIRLIGPTSATFGWWGGAYAWSPAGDRLAYAFADEVGTIELSDTVFDDAAEPIAVDLPRTALRHFPAWETGADWAWIPALSWSADGRFLAFTEQAADESGFNLVTIDTRTGQSHLTLPDVGIWSVMGWPPLAESGHGEAGQLVLSRADDPVDESADNPTDSAYALWLVDSDGENARRIFPPDGIDGTIARSSQSIAWGSDPDRVAFIFAAASSADELYILDRSTGEFWRTGADDTAASRPTWAPYGAAAGR